MNRVTIYPEFFNGPEAFTLYRDIGPRYLDALVRLFAVMPMDGDLDYSTDPCDAPEHIEKASHWTSKPGRLIDALDEAGLVLRTKDGRISVMVPVGIVVIPLPDQKTNS